MIILHFYSFIPHSSCVFFNVHLLLNQTIEWNNGFYNDEYLGSKKEGDVGEVQSEDGFTKL